MKKKRIICLFLVLTMILGSSLTLSTGAAGEVKEVYVSADGQSHGTDSTATTINDAIATINSSSAAMGKIILIGDITVSISSYNTLSTAHTKPITVTSDNGERTLTFANAKTSDRYYVLGGETVFENIKLKATNGQVFINAAGHELTMGDGVVVDSTGKSLSLVGVYGSASSSRMIINSGSFGYVFSSLGWEGGTLNGDAYLEINSGASVKYLSIANCQKTFTVNGKTDIVINGASIANINIAESKTAALSKINDSVNIKVNDIVQTPTIVTNNGTVQYYTGDSVPTENGSVYFKHGVEFNFSSYEGNEAYKQAIMEAIDDAAIPCVKYSKTSAPQYYGYQLSSTSGQNGETVYSIRFLATLNDNCYTGAGYEITANINSTQKQFSKKVSHAYSSVIASDELGDMAAVTAEQMGGKYIIALTIKNIPLEEGDIEFSVSPYSEVGEQVYRQAATNVVCSTSMALKIKKEAELNANAILSSENKYSASDVSGSGKCYYVSYSQGNDSNNGTTPETPWKTIDKVSQASLPEGSVVLFKRGDTWRLDSYAQSGKAAYLLLKSNVIYSSYGEGAKPIISGSPVDAAKEGEWSAVSGYTNVWKYSCTYGGMSDPLNDDVGNMIFNGGEAYGYKMLKNVSSMPFSGLGDLDSEYEFWFDPDDHHVYLYCQGNPSEVYDSIEIGVRLNLVRITQQSNVVFDNFSVKYGAAHGVAMALATNVQVTNCEFAWLGGGVYTYTAAGGNTGRYGNGVEVNRDCKDIYINNNYVYQIYDAGLSHQYDSRSAPSSTLTCYFENINYTNNVIDKCFYGIEFFVGAAIRDTSIYVLNSSGTATSESKELTDDYPRYMDNINIQNNYILDSGYGWGYWREAGGQPGAAHIKAWENFDQSIVDKNNDGKMITITGNKMMFSRYDVMYGVYQNEADMPNISDNIFVQSESGKTITLATCSTTVSNNRYALTKVAVENREYWNEASVKTNPYLGQNTYVTEERQ